MIVLMPWWLLPFYGIAVAFVFMLRCLVIALAAIGYAAWWVGRLLFAAAGSVLTERFQRQRRHPIMFKTPRGTPVDMAEEPTLELPAVVVSRRRGRVRGA